METKKVLARLSELAQIDVDAIGCYVAAINRIHDENIRTKLAEFRTDHSRHVQDLNAMIVQLGGERVIHDADIKGAILKGMTTLTSIIGTEGALVAMIANEQITNRSYSVALKGDLPQEVRALIEKNYADEQRHLAWIKAAAKGRLWERREEAHP